MKRENFKKLKEWKKSKRRKPLLLKGARQAGKTYLLKEFGKNEYENFAYFNFEEDSDLKHFFKGKIEPEQIIKNLSLYQKWDIDYKKHLIIFDEIQASNEALNSLKYFCEKANQYHIVAAGSLLGIKLSKAKSFPVGKVNFLELYPMTFLEFLSAMGEEKLAKYIKELKNASESIPLPIHNQLIEILRYYYFVGGMPEAVKHFVENKNFNEVREIQKEIINSYVLDFAKYAPVSDVPKLSLIWESIPAHLSKENKKFIFSALKRSARAREYENALQWLEGTGLILKSFLLKKIAHPLQSFCDRSCFKVFCLDVGLLGALAKIPAQILAYKDRIFVEYEGALVENYVACQLVAEKNMPLYYWTSTGRAEIDFVCEHKMKIYPLEVKAGLNPKSKSLKFYQKKFKPDKSYRTNLLNFKKEKEIINMPLYAISQFPLEN